MMAHSLYTWKTHHRKLLSTNTKKFIQATKFDHHEQIDSMVFPFCCHIIHPECINSAAALLTDLLVRGVSRLQCFWFLECSVFCTPYLGHAPTSEPLSVSVKATIPKPARKSSDSTAPAATSSPRPASMSKSKSPRLRLYNPGVKG